MIKKRSLAQLDNELLEGEKATAIIMYLSENKGLLKTKRGKDLLMECQKIKSKWDEYENLKLELRLNNPNMEHLEYMTACYEIAERLGI